jgi:predicted nucleic acid-binding protein
MIAPGGEQNEERYVFDTRPLINTILAANGYILDVACSGLVVTTASVQSEFAASAAVVCSKSLVQASLGDRYAAQIANACTSWTEYFGNHAAIQVVSLTDVEVRISLQLERQESHSLSIDPGEADVLAVCAQRGWIAVLDDAPARGAALALGIPTLGSVELLIRAVRRGAISHSDGEEALDRMRSAYWFRAPRYSLSDVLSGKAPIWPGG